MTENLLKSPQDFLKKYGVDTSNLSYKERLKQLNNIIMERGIDIETLEITTIQEYEKELSNLNFEIYNARVCILQVKKLRDYKRKERFAEIAKKLVIRRR